VKETGDRSFLPDLRERFVKEENVDLRRDLALALGAMEDREALPLLVAALGDDQTPEPVRDAALNGVETIGGDLAVKTLIDVLGKDDVPAARQPRLIAALAKFKAKEAVPVLLARSRSNVPAVRAASVDALAAVGNLESAGPRLRESLDDPELEVRNAALAALAALKDFESVPAFLEAYGHASTRFEATMALAALPDVRSLQVYLAGLSDRNQDLRKACSTALSTIRDEAAPVLEKLSERHELPGAAVPELVKIFTGLQPITQWRVIGPFPKESKPPVNPEGTIDLNASVAGLEGKPTTWKLTQAIDAQGQVDLGKVFSNNDTVYAFGYAEINADAARKAQLAVGSDDTLTVWLNGKKVYEYLDRRGFAPDAARVDVDLVQGTNRLVVNCGNEGGGWQYSVSVTSAADYAFLKGGSPGAFNPDEFREFAMKNPGKAEHGQALFSDMKGLACAKCHVVKGQGGAVGPDLSGVGATYPREELIASVLYPSQKIFSGYEPIIVATGDGRILTGILKRESPEEIEIQDADAKTLVLKSEEIDERKTSDVSLMPSGLAEGLSKEDFADVIAYLESLKDKPAEAKSAK
jgi:putative heme-binding domain-containing protein